MKKIIFGVIVFFVGAVIFAQQKFALVIGNGNYTNITKLNNPVNDANDMEAALRGLGFTVEKVLNGNINQMENGITNLKKRLKDSKSSYGFFFYAGHGVQSNGENYLIPIDANIQSESFLKRQSISVQEMLDELNDAGNELNVVVLDACRDNPFPWKRSGSRGLQVVGHQPADSIIVYATSAGSTAADGTGRNGLFTTHLLDNLKQPGIEVTEVFRRTMGDVARASGNQQRPAVYNQFAGIAYLGSRPSNPSPQPSPTPMPNQTYKIGDRGPAGGIVFYDKGNNSDGWRYLEAAPTDAGTNVSWGILNAYEEKTRTDVGSGRANTTYLLEDHTKLKEKGRAAQVAAAYKANGFEDWFLPSYEELNLMYQNLKARGLGNFSNTWYWSSSDCNDRFNAQSVYFSNGAFTKGDKKQSASVRAVRWF